MKVAIKAVFMNWCSLYFTKGNGLVNVPRDQLYKWEKFIESSKIGKTKEVVLHD
ncbi:hypothetical protein ER45_029350 (plasmid) [Bacillus mycoides]|nr:hypothetical protein ER45_029350 [Bacillus mycoides]